MPKKTTKKIPPLRNTEACRQWRTTMRRHRKLTELIAERRRQVANLAKEIDQLEKDAATVEAVRAQLEKIVQAENPEAKA